jgi:hypothetical protein
VATKSYHMLGWSEPMVRKSGEARTVSQRDDVVDPQHGVA